jgi:hypothetical protein
LSPEASLGLGVRVKVQGIATNKELPSPYATCHSMGRCVLRGAHCFCLDGDTSWTWPSRGAVCLAIAARYDFYSTYIHAHTWIYICTGYCCQYYTGPDALPAPSMAWAMLRAILEEEREPPSRLSSVPTRPPCSWPPAASPQNAKLAIRCHRGPQCKNSCMNQPSSQCPRPQWDSVVRAELVAVLLLASFLFSSAFGLHSFWASLRR